jgi:hypothetical protein
VAEFFNENYVVLMLVALVLGILGFLGLVLAFVQTRRVSRLQRRLAAMSQGSDGRSLEGALDVNFRKVVALESEVGGLGGRTSALEDRGRLALQRFGLVRFNPFEDTGSNQSFALALLDDRDDGIIVSSLHSRQSTRVYAKPIAGGRSDAALSDEEAAALQKAREGRPRA